MYSAQWACAARARWRAVCYDVPDKGPRQTPWSARMQLRGGSAKARSPPRVAERGVSTRLPGFRVSVCRHGLRERPGG